ncbi:MAG TPA: 50S ribosomal protein L30 [Thermotogota bacterium]|nr:50S ribosomal protein L30 [Thermotogota bacterium]HRW91358.1 50S ribosomal protein L30 [Thermotogota bacterium]
MARIRLTLVKSPIGYKWDQKETIRRLGLRKMHSTVEKEATAPVLGMVNKVRHLVEMEMIEDQPDA